jgi:putative Holliday junction resolvase
VRVLALDYGSARCGCALSDPTGTLATPIDPIERPATRKGFARVVDLVRDRGAERVVVGLPWADRLAAAVPVPVALYDERFTTAIAARSAGDRTSEDSRAAAVLLEDWLVRHAREVTG